MKLNFFVIFSLMLIAIGCGEPGKPDFEVYDDLHPVMGELRFQGEPTPEASIHLHPMPLGTEGPVVSAVVDEEGAFQVYTFRPEGKGLGAPAGDYRATISWFGPTVGLTEEQKDDLKELLPAKYGRPQSSPVDIQVSSGENQVGTIDLD